METFLGWLREFFRNDDIVSALTGEAVEPPFSDPKRKRNARISTVVGYVTLFGFIVFLSTILPEPPKLSRNSDLPNLIFVMTEGPGGGGGGGGELSEDPASVQKIEGEDQAKIAVAVKTPEDKLIFEDPERPPAEEKEKDVVEEKEVPEIVAPVLAQAPDDTTEKGILEGQEQLVASRGPGANGDGIGEGKGSGLGEGRGGGFGGGAYRMGSGLTPPVLVRQIQPGFTEEALARKIQGEVVVEVVILKDGSVRPVRVLRGLPAGLNEKAFEALSQWKFIPAKLKGQPVDLVAEIVADFHIL